MFEIEVGSMSEELIIILPLDSKLILNSTTYSYFQNVILIMMQPSNLSYYSYVTILGNDFVITAFKTISKTL